MIIVNFASVRIITDNVEGLVDFYENVLGVAAKRPSPVFAEFILPTCTLAIGHTQTTALFGMDTTRGANHHQVILEFHTADVDTEYIRLRPHVNHWVQEPTTMPWGNRSPLFRDPDGNLVNLFEPVTEEAIKRFSMRHK